MIMHGTWYKGPQLAHPHSHTEYHQFRSYPSFVVAPYHENSSAAAPTAPSVPILVEGSFTSVNTSNHLTVLSPTIKIEQNYNDPSINGVEDYALNGLDCSGVDNGTFKKPTNYVWPNASSQSEANNNTISDTRHITNPATPPTPPPDTHINLEQTQKSYSNSFKPIEDSELIEIPSTQPPPPPSAATSIQQQHQHQEEIQSHKSIKHKHTTTTSSSAAAVAATSSSLVENHLGNSSTMPIGGVQGQNPTQGLVHWMSAVMAEHMTGQTHHDPSGVGMHYMWNGNVDQYGQHNKEIADHNFWPPTPPTTTLRNHSSMNSKQGYEAKMNDHHNNLQKGHFIDDNRLEHHAVTPQGGSVLGSAGHHGNHVSHHGSASASSLLVVPQPINATKIGSSLGGAGGGTGRKYQCKMCPQVSFFFTLLILVSFGNMF